MPALNFMKRFASPVESGVKRTTIRARDAWTRERIAAAIEPKSRALPAAALRELK